MSAASCPFPYVIAPACTTTIAATLAWRYWAFVGLYAVLTAAVAIPTISAVLVRYQASALATPSLDRPGALLVRVSIAAVAFAIAAPDPLGYAAIVPPALLELTSAITSLVLISIALSAVFRWTRDLMLLGVGGLARLHVLTRWYTLVQYGLTGTWAVAALMQAAAGRWRASAAVRAVPLVASLVVLVGAYASASVAARAAFRSMSRDACKASTPTDTVSAQKHCRAALIVRQVQAATAVLVVLVAPVAVARVVAILSAPSYPDPPRVPATLAGVTAVGALRLVKLLFAAVVVFVARQRLAHSGAALGVVLGATTRPTKVGAPPLTVEMTETAAGGGGGGAKDADPHSGSFVNVDLEG